MEVDPEPSPAHGGLATPPANPGSPECSPSGHQPDGSANAEVVASTPQNTQPASPPASPGPQAASAAAAQDSVQEGTPPRVPKVPPARRSLLRREVELPLPA